jgi:hypothetical protein
MVDADPQRWLDTTLVDIPEARIREVEITPASGPSYKLSREKKEDADFTVTGVPKGRELSSPSMASTIARELAGLTLSDVRKAGATDASASTSAAGSAAAPASAGTSATARATGAAAATSPKAIYRTFDGLEVQLQGHQDGERRYLTVASQSTAKETADESAKLAARAKDWEFEIQNYKYDGIFKPIEDLLKPKEEKKK